MSPKNFFLWFSPKMLLFSKKLLNGKIFKTSFPIKKVIFIFAAWRPVPFKKELGPRNGFLPFFQKIQLFFLKNRLNNKIFITSFVSKKSYVNFWCKAPSFLKKLSNVLPKQFFTVFSVNTFFFFQKNCWTKNIQHLIFGRNGYIPFWCKMTPYRSLRGPVAVFQTK